MSINEDHIGLALKALRLDKGLEISEVAKQINLRQSAVLAIEQGVVFPSVLTLILLSNIYDTELSKLMYLAEAIYDLSLPLCSTIMIEGILENLGTEYERK